MHPKPCRTARHQSGRTSSAGVSACCRNSASSEIERSVQRLELSSAAMDRVRRQSSFQLRFDLCCLSRFPPTSARCPLIRSSCYKAARRRRAGTCTQSRRHSPAITIVTQFSKYLIVFATKFCSIGVALRHTPKRRGVRKQEASRVDDRRPALVDACQRTTAFENALATQGTARGRLPNISFDLSHPTAPGLYDCCPATPAVILATIAVMMIID